MADDTGGVWDRVKNWAGALPQIPDPLDMLAGEVGRTAGAVKQFAGQTPQEQLGQVWQGVKGVLANPPDPWRSWEEGRPLEAMLSGPQTGMLKGFYSPAAKAATTLPAKGSPEQLLATLRNRNIPGFGQEEQWSGVNQALSGRPSVTREELARHFEQGMPDLRETVLGGGPHVSIQRSADQALLDELNDIHREDYHDLQRAADISRPGAMRQGYIEPKFQDYTLPGGENYREVLMHLPGGDRRTPLQTARDLFGNPELRSIYDLTPEQLRILQPELDKQVEQGERLYRSSHWDTPNVVAHLRMSDRPLPEGGKGLHLEELQSDWGQKGREEGFSRENELSNLFNERNTLTEKYAKSPHDSALLERLRVINETISDITRRNVGVPSGPYVTKTQHWTDLGLKRALQEAAHGGYDRLLITPGAEQLMRWDNPGLKTFYDTVIPKQLKVLLAKIDKNAKIEPYQLPGKPMPSSYQPERRASSTVPDE